MGVLKTPFHTKTKFQEQQQYEECLECLFQVVNQRGTLLTAVQIGLSSRLYGAPGDTILVCIPGYSK